jgi:replicative DNA helicase
MKKKKIKLFYQDLIMGLLQKTKKVITTNNGEAESTEIKQPSKAVVIEEIKQSIKDTIVEEIKEEKPKVEKQKTKPNKDIGGSLIDNLKKEFEVTPYDMITICAKTGFDTLDYLVAISKTSLGLSLRTFNTSYGSSGSGKTTICIQMAANIINNSEKGMLFFFDGEKSASMERLEKLGVDTSPDKFLLIKKNTTIEGFFKLLKLLSIEREKDKITFGEKYLMENPYIVIADSFNAFASEKEIEADAQYNSAMVWSSASSTCFL